VTNVSVQGLGFRVQGSGVERLGPAFRLYLVWGPGFRAWDSGFRNQGSTTSQKCAAVPRRARI